MSSQRVPSLLFAQTLRLPAKASAYECLAFIHSETLRTIHRFSPDVAAVEASIYVQNTRTAMILGSARGAGLAAVAGEGIPIHEYPPLRVKQAIVGYGRATKDQVSAMMKTLVPGIKTEGFDESDAAAVALCHALTFRS